MTEKKRKKSSQIPPVFLLSFPEMHQAARNCLNSFEEDKTDFIAWDAAFADPFAADWQALINTAETFPTDHFLQKEQAQLTIEMKKAMQNCRLKFQDAKYFIKKAFPDNAEAWHKFGFDDYNVAQRSQSRLAEFMGTFHSIAEEEKVALIAVGYTQLMIDDIQTVLDAITNAISQQKAFKLSRPGITRDRRIANNEVWKVFLQVSQVGKRIYKNNYAKYQRYLIPKSKKRPRKKAPQVDGN